MKGLKNRDNYFVAFIFVSIFCLASFFSLLYCFSMDHVWNYGFSAKIYSGLIPYRDFNLLLTPLSFYVTALFFNLLGNDFLSYTIIGSLIICSMFYLIYRIVLLICSDKKIAINVLLLTILYNIISLTVYTYNILSLVIILTIILFEFKDRVGLFSNIVIGILFGLIFLTKQNIFFVIILLSSINILISTAIIRVKLKMLAVRVLAALSIIFTYLIYLYNNNALYNFIDYTFLGLLDFSEKNKLIASNLLYFYCILPAIIIIRAIYLVIKQKRYDLNDKLFILLFYAVGGLSMIYPIFDLNHLTIGFILVFLLIPYVFLNSQLLVSFIFRVLYITFFSILVIFTIFVIKTKDCLLYTNSNHYRHIITNQSNIDNINEVITYINLNRAKGKNIVILDSRAMFYFSELGIYNNPYDLLVQGNLGYKGEEKTLAKIKQLDDNTVFLVGDTNNIQEIKEIKLYAMCHYNFIGKVDNFFIYEKPQYVDENKQCNINVIDIPIE